VRGRESYRDAAVIATVQHHGDADTLLREMYEPGRHDPDGIPHLIAGSQDPASLEPERRSNGSRNIARLAGWLGHVPAAARGNAGEQRLWHCIVRAQPGDRALSDRQWAQAAVVIMDRTGLGPRGDRRSVRWVAARHGRDHIHVVAALVRQDGAALPAGAGAAALAQGACRAARDSFGLRRAAGSKAGATRHHRT
jgi:hypothetical protein